MENIIENNKIIAEFLDWEFDDLSETFETPFLKLVDPHAFGDEQFSCKLHDFELKFHLDRNWLMLVVEEIKDLEDNSKDKTTEEFKEFKKILALPIYTKIEAVYNACVEFIKWYNKQK